jgi:hypothetical protein
MDSQQKRKELDEMKAKYGVDLEKKTTWHLWIICNVNIVLCN